MKIAVAIPDRGDRPKFMENCIKMMNNQTLQPITILKANHTAHTDKCDITLRYRLSYEILSKSESGPFDLIAFIENDDWYAPDYLQYMVRKWEENGRPDLFGTNYTIYYHLKLKRYFTFRHLQRASAMNTFIRPGLEFTWPQDHDPYTDQWLWMRSEITNKLSIEPEYIISIGIKHGIGKVGGDFHDNFLSRYINEDNGFLKNNLDPESYKFYSSIEF
jgi:hypothetical protein